MEPAGSSTKIYIRAQNYCFLDSVLKQLFDFFAKTDDNIL